MDEIAYTLGMDPVELRKKNMIRLGDIDELSAELGEGKKGLPRHIRSCGLPECLERGAKAIDWVNKRQEYSSVGPKSVRPAERSSALHPKAATCGAAWAWRAQCKAAASPASIGPPLC